MFGHSTRSVGNGCSCGSAALAQLCLLLIVGMLPGPHADCRLHVASAIQRFSFQALAVLMLALPLALPLAPPLALPLHLMLQPQQSQSVHPKLASLLAGTYF